MKKLMVLMVAMTMLMMAVAVMAAGKIALTDDAVSEMRKLVYVEKNAVAAQAYMDTIDWTAFAADDVKGRFVGCNLAIDRLKGIAPNSIDEAKAIVAKHAAAVGLTDKDVIAVRVMDCLYYVGKYQFAYDYYKSLATTPNNMKDMVLHTCIQLKKYDETIAIALQLNDYVAASTCAAVNLKDKVKTFEYCKKAMLDQYCTAPLLIQLLDRVGGFDYSDTSVTPEMQKSLLIAVDLKYRRFLVKDKATWEPIIAGIRLTLQGYGVEVK